jgi:NAD(P)-dependent dehydrogenase (short-subunit alcohol dehydrogenase family)
MFNRSMARARDPAAARDYSRNRHALKRFGEAGEIANGIVYLLSGEASFTTGSVLTIDGGWRAA